jgi:hypothetical protein
VSAPHRTFGGLWVEGASGDALRLSRKLRSGMPTSLLVPPTAPVYSILVCICKQYL